MSQLYKKKKVLPDQPTVRQRIWLMLFDDFLNSTPPATASEIDVIIESKKSSVYLNKMAVAGEVKKLERTGKPSSRVTWYVDDSCFMPDDLSYKALKSVMEKGN